jgi:putative ABC transport system permease protein
MKFVDVLKRSGRNLRQAKIRTLLTALAIAVGGFTLTLTLAAASGAREYADRLVAANTVPDAVFVANDEHMFSAGTTKPQEYNDDLANIFGTLLKQLNQKDIAELEALPHVEDVHQDYNLNAQFITREGAKRYTGFLQAYNPAQKPEMKAGEAPEALPNGSVLMSDEYVSRLKFKNPKDALGKTITLQLRKLSGGEEAKQYKVAGVTTKTTLGIDFVPDGLYLSEDDARAANDYVNGGTVLEGRVPTATVRGDGTITPDELKKQITDLGYAARTAEDAQAFLNQIISVLQGIIVLFGLITLIASFFGVVNTQYISVLERTREIGLMKALGASKRTVSRLFMVEATWIGFLGALLGSLAAMALGSALNPVISKQLNFGDEKLLIFEPGQIIALIIFLMLVTTIAGLLPARKAAKLDPIEALRTE